jgi:small subunit ribosomal protein S5
MVLAALDGLQHLITVEQAAKERGVEVGQIGYRSRAKSRTMSIDPRRAAVAAVEVG